MLRLLPQSIPPSRCIDYLTLLPSQRCIDITYRLEHYVITDHVFLCYTKKIGESKNQASF
jgi:hypothetical protein